MAGPSDNVTLAPVTKQAATHKAATRIDPVPPIRFGRRTDGVRSRRQYGAGRSYVVLLSFGLPRSELPNRDTSRRQRITVGSRYFVALAGHARTKQLRACIQ